MQIISIPHWGGLWGTRGATSPKRGSNKTLPPNARSGTVWRTVWGTRLEMLLKYLLNVVQNVKKIEIRNRRLHVDIICAREVVRGKPISFMSCAKLTKFDVLKNFSRDISSFLCKT
jgi:hypothetical protein